METIALRVEVWLRPPAGARTRKKRKIKNKGGGVICAPSAKQGIATTFFIQVLNFFKKILVHNGKVHFFGQHSDKAYIVMKKVMTSFKKVKKKPKKLHKVFEHFRLICLYFKNGGKVSK